jgi:hypothetical protein
MASVGPLDLLRRRDKWFLAGGRGVAYDPPFPRALEVPGFWDTVHVADVGVERLFTVFLKRAECSRPVSLAAVHRDWRPDRLRIEYAAAEDGLRVVETRTILECGTAVCELEIAGTDGAVEVDVFLWSLLDDFRECETVEDRAGQWVPRAEETPRGYEIGLGVRQRYQTHPTGVVTISLGADRAPDARVAARCQTTATAPLWDVSVFPEKVVDGRLSGETLLDVGPDDPNALLHLGLQWRLRVPSGETVTVRCMARLSVGMEPDRVTLPTPADPVRQAENEWRRYFAGVPEFDCSDPYLRRYYWYRWYGLRLCTVDVDLPPLGAPCVFEGIDYFRRRIS